MREVQTVLIMDPSCGCPRCRDLYAQTMGVLPARDLQIHHIELAIQIAWVTGDMEELECLIEDLWVAGCYRRHEAEREATPAWAQRWLDWAAEDDQ
jgi:hypothetical protein